MSAITIRQKTAIWTIVRKNGIDEAEFRDWLEREYGTRSTRELSVRDAESAINALRRFAGERFEGHRTITWGITERQMRYIRRLAEDMGWDNPKRLDGLVKKMFSPKNRLELLTKSEGTKLIIALGKMGQGHDGACPSEMGATA